MPHSRCGSQPSFAHPASQATPATAPPHDFVAAEAGSRPQVVISKKRSVPGTKEHFFGLTTTVRYRTIRTMSIVEYAHTSGRAFAESLSRAKQKALGQFMTPPAIATFMARRAIQGLEQEVVRLLEPSAGAGILLAATVDELLRKEVPPRTIHVTLFEIDQGLIPCLKRLGDRMRRAANARSVQLTCSIRNEDFLLSKEAVNGQAIADLVIANPPYLKLNKSDARASAHAYAVYGQPNIYGLFLAACARLVDTTGRYCFITPRSWLGGSYFAQVRRQMLHWLNFEGVHVFDSRKDHFSDDEILQEAVILWATARTEQEPPLDVLVSRSHGITDLAIAPVTAIPFARLVGTDDQRMIAIHEEHEDPFQTWTDTLASHHLRVSTGPVVAFRATDFTRSEASEHTVPLLWMQHIQPMRVQWPMHKKREHINAVSDSAWMLLPNKPMVVLRRFSPKEAVRRITAAPYSGELPGPSIGLENHLNYIVRPGGTITVDEAKGLAAFLSSALVDAHVRALAGSTQINATDLRKLPLPPLAQLIEIGQRLPAQATFAQVDSVVDEVLLKATPATHPCAA